MPSGYLSQKSKTYSACVGLYSGCKTQEKLFIKKCMAIF